MPPVGRHFDQRVQDERAQMQPWMWQRGMVLLADPVAHRQQVEVENPGGIGHRPLAAELRFDLVQGRPSASLAAPSSRFRRRH